MVAQELLTKLGFTVDPSGIKQGQDQLTKFKRFIGGLALGAAVLGIGKSAVMASGQMESLTAQFKTMLGSSEAAVKMMGDLNKFAGETPFETMDAASATQTLLGFGVESKDVLGILHQLGDVAGANSERFSGLALVYGQIQSTGKLMGQDLLQLINQGFNPLRVMSDATGISIAKLKEKMSAGQISAKAVADAFKIATSKGGMYFENLKNQAGTWQGVVSTASDNLKMSLIKAIDPFMPTLKAIVKALGAIDLSPIVAQFNQMAAGGNNWAEIIVDLANNLVQVLAWVLAIFNVIAQNQAIVKAFLVTWAILWGAGYIKMIIQAGLGLLSLSRATLIAKGTTQALALANLKLYLSNIKVAWSMGGIKFAAAEAGLAMKAFATSSTLAMGVLGIALMGIIWAMQKIDELEQINEEQSWTNEGQRVQAYTADKAQEIADDKALIKQMNAQGYGDDNKQVQAIKKRLTENESILKRMKKVSGEVIDDAARRNSSGSEAPPDFKAMVDSSSGAVEAQLKKTAADSGTKTMNINNELKMEINNAKGDGKSGLSNKQVVDLADTAVRAQFNIQLRKVLVGAR